MLVNFALDCLETSISCDKPSSDGCEPSNLLHCKGEFTRRHQGFLAERFIKPPVTLTLQFPCPVNVSHIVLDPQVGSQRSSAIQIFTAVLHEKCLPQLGKSSDTQNSSVAESGKDEGATCEPEPIFKKVGSIQCSQPGQVCFNNPRFLSTPSATSNSMVSSQCHVHYSELRHHQWKMLSAADFLAVRIVGTVNGSVAAIGRLEVWGQPARSSPQKLRNSVLQKYATAMGLPVEGNTNVNVQGTNVTHGKVNDSMWNMTRKSGDPCKQDDMRQQSNTQTLNTMSSLPVSAPNIQKEVNIPDDFLDTLTFEVMSTPMLLPSGHSIDVSTLDRFSDVEATYGRQPSDPFTGLVFTATRKPVLNKTLKMRIDRFLSEHANDPSLQCVPRTLGGAKHVPVTLHANNRDRDEDRSETMHNKPGPVLKNLKRKKPNCTEYDYPQTCLRVKEQSFACNESISSASGGVLAKKKVKTENEDTGQSVASSVTDDSGPMTNAESHEERLRSSLKNSLSSVLQGLPSFTAPPVNPSGRADSPELDHCSTCGVKLRQRDTEIRTAECFAVYLFPCKHLVCRACLLKTGSVNDVTCSACDRQFKRTDIVRTHV